MRFKVVVKPRISRVFIVGLAGVSILLAASYCRSGREDRFLTSVEKLPANQREVYIYSHLDELCQLQVDADKSKLDRLTRLLPPR